MSISIVAIIILTLYVGIGQLDAISIQMGPYTPLFGGTITGLVLGDLQTGLIVGGTLQLMTLGVATFGGATVPDFLSGSVMGAAFAILSGKGPEYGIGLAVPIGLLLTQLDIVGRMTNTFFQHMADKAAEKGDYKGVERANLLGALPWMLTRMIPVFIGLTFGDHVVNAINAFIPEWVMVGLKTAGAILPAMGIAILMRYLPLKKYFPFYIIGFVLMAFGGANFSLLGAALVGLAFAGIYLLTKREAGAGSAATSNQSSTVYVDDEEVEIDE
ncbi:PTS mannose/fructose/sorbose/N-acetylgalactosamine transporter subunit IIC [Isobaculum melis]|uniref:PTS system, mannose-specific IIC component n=1 Tax=Isobaculum melis TaxID=142588 RepID=A0A1H9PPB5_9LACT|nr:PTS sugar transporter subunit IIC [Isobaculum melis]SER49645.1 PTS system, mannose-specific IIC component [Isobaculum melis]